MKTVFEEGKNVAREAMVLIREHGVAMGLRIIAREGGEGVRIALGYGIAFSNARLHGALQRIGVL